MRTLAAAVVIGIAVAPLTWAQGRSAVDHRHDHATGVGHDVSEHHFVLANDGGSIRLEVTDPQDVTGRDRIREHLQGIARAFGEGDFSMPRRIHDQAPPGVDVMTARRNQIHYSYAATEKGGLVTISTKDAKALAAIHKFLRFQIRDHGTQDSTE